MTKTIRWGILGPGTIANKFAKAIKNVEGAELVAVASRSMETANAFALKYDIPNAFEGYEAMANSDLIDAVYVATPHPFHKPCAEIFLNSKKHVLCEKPVCVNAKDAESLNECAKGNGVFLMEAMWTRFLPAVNEAINVAKSGRIGEIRGIRADFCYNSPPEEDPKLYKKDMAGGSLLDVGVYALNFARLFLGDDIEKTTAVSDIKDGVDRHTNVLIKYKNGAIAQLSSAIDVQKSETAFVYGTKGHLEIPTFYGAQEFFINVGTNAEHIERKSIGDGFEEEIIEVCDCIRKGKTKSDIMPMEESIKILEQMDEIREQIGLKYPFEI